MVEEQAYSVTTDTITYVEYTALGKALYSMVSFVEGYDQHMLGMCMRAFELTLGLSQAQLSMMVTVSNMSRLGCCLIWGLLADKFKSNHVFSAGLLLMGMASIVLSSASQYISILFLRFIHGFAFACIYPVQQKIVAEEFSDPCSNLVFGIMQALNCIGSLLCAIITTRIAPKILLGYYGWRTSYLVLGYVWIIFGIAIVFGMTSEKCGNNGMCTAKPKTNMKEVIDGAFLAVFNCRTAGVSIFTLFVAETPMCAFSYMTIYLQYLGVSDTMAGVAVAATLIGGAVGSGVGGLIFKHIAEKYDRCGELCSGIAVLVIRLVVCVLFFVWRPPSGPLLWYHYVELSAFGGTLVTVGGVDRALLKKAIEEKCQGTAAAAIRTISGIASSLILFQVSAYLSEKVFGYVPSREPLETMQMAVKHRNAEALRQSMMYIILSGTILNVLCYITLICCLPSKKRQTSEEK
ncbi:Multidrug resistance protein mdtL [Babesia bigemina]|uniref:Multidrug resistance protein mdtL n=1 Tax=Babesia bigemina TaxID=5866 RepID=A0A061D4G5_BABBI|nr:Multidrug resistance protein mdtL [Babesia bigemina]CDR95621.1 Multidrug resistance protein mdtL [Babesia bigemina]|eukprot:XP_012767807.1 Multidrug resistance protein mdtL [Babesia bigemina]